MNNSLSGVTGSNIPLTPRLESKTIKSESSVPKAEVTENNTPKDGVTLTRDQQQEPPKKVKVATFPQDPFMDKPSVEEIDQSKVGTNLEGPRAKAYDKGGAAIADPDGNFFYEPTSPKFDQVNSFVCSYKTLDMHQGYLGEKVDWAFGGDQLEVKAHAGEGANAYYARWQESINFFYFKSEGLDKTVQTSQSVDVVSHETGHAVLDGMKPRFLGSWGGETMAFHEAFADSTAMLYTLNNEANLPRIIEETGGDLSNSNRLSWLGEEFGKAIHLMNQDTSDDNRTYLRNSRNEFKWVPMNELPEHGDREELTSEAHSFSRVFSGAFYDCIHSLYDKFTEELPPLASQQGESVPDRVGALKAARDTMGPILLKGVELAPSSGITFRQAAIGMLKADLMINEGKNKDLLAKVFIDRNIIKPEEVPQDDPSMAGIRMEKPVSGKEEAMEFLKTNADKLGVNASDYGDVKVKTNKRGETTLEFESTREVPLSSHGIHKVAGVDNLWVDIHGGMTLGFDKNGNMVSKNVDEIDRDKVQKAVSFINCAEGEGLVRHSPFYKASNLFKSHNVPYKAEVYHDPSTGRIKVQQIPIVVD